MDVHQRNYREKIASLVIKNLAKRRMAASYAPTISQAKEEVLAMIPPGSLSAVPAPCRWWRWAYGLSWPPMPGFR